MIYLTSYVPTDTVRPLAVVFLVYLTVSCCNLGEITNGIQKTDETETLKEQFHKIRKKDTSKESSGPAPRRIYALKDDLLSSAGGVQSSTGRGYVSQGRINRRDSALTLWPMHRLQNRPFPSMGGALYARGELMAGQRIHYVDVQPGKFTRGTHARRISLSKLHEAAAQTLRTASDPVLPMRRIWRRVRYMRTESHVMRMRRVQYESRTPSLSRHIIQYKIRGSKPLEVDT